MIPFFDARSMHGELNAELESAFKKVLQRSHFVLGDEVSAFEREFADYCASRFCVSVGNGLDALVLALRGWGIGPGDEVIVPGQTFVATWLAVSAVGATPIPVDVRPDTVLIDIDKVAGAVTERTKAVIAVHLFGQAVDVSRLRSVLPAGVRILEDAAQAHGACRDGKPVGSLGDAAAFSFYPTKNLGCLGDGGAVTTSDPELARNVAMLRNYGSEKKYLHEVAGVNSRLDELQAAFLRVKLPYLKGWNDSRKKMAARYSSQLAGIGALELPGYADAESHVFHLYVVKTAMRDQLHEALQKEEISSLIHYPQAPGDQPIYKDGGWLMPNSRHGASNSLSLPLWPGMPEKVVDQVSDAVRRFFAR